MNLLRQWPRNYIAAELLQHPEPEQYLLSGGLRRALPKTRAGPDRTPAASPTIEQSGGRTSATPCSGSAALSILDEGYPELLRQIPDPPLLFYYRGNIELLGQPAVAVVGARRCTSQGRDNARVLARQLAEHGIENFQAPFRLLWRQAGSQSYDPITTGE